jgi:hypothetical protein
MPDFKYEDGYVKQGPSVMYRKAFLRVGYVDWNWPFESEGGSGIIKNRRFGLASELSNKTEEDNNRVAVFQAGSKHYVPNSVLTGRIFGSELTI